MVVVSCSRKQPKQGYWAFEGYCAQLPREKPQSSAEPRWQQQYYPQTEKMVEFQLLAKRLWEAKCDYLESVQNNVLSAFNARGIWRKEKMEKWIRKEYGALCYHLVEGRRWGFEMRARCTRRQLSARKPSILNIISPYLAHSLSYLASSRNLHFVILDCIHWPFTAPLQVIQDIAWVASRQTA